jgi:hypothetical protein
MAASDAKRLSHQLVGIAQHLEIEKVRDKAGRRAALLDAARILADYDRLAAEVAELKAPAAKAA